MNIIDVGVADFDVLGYFIDWMAKQVVNKEVLALGFGNYEKRNGRRWNSISNKKKGWN